MGPLINILARIAGPRLIAAGTRMAKGTVKLGQRAARSLRRLPGTARSGSSRLLGKTRQAGKSGASYVRRRARVASRAFGRTALGQQASFVKRAFAHALDPEEAPDTRRRGFSELARQGSNMTDLMSGRKTRADIEGEEDARVNKAKLEQKAIEQLESFNAAVGKVAKGLAVVAGIGTALERFSKAVLETSRELSRGNGTIGRAFALLDRDRLLRMRASGAARAGTTERLAGAVSNMEEAWRPIRDGLANSLNRFMAAFAGIVAPIGSILNSLLTIISPLLYIIEKGLLVILKVLQVTLQTIAFFLKPIAWLLEKLIWLLDKLVRLLSFDKIKLTEDDRPKVTVWEGGITAWAKEAVARKMPPLPKAK